MYGPRSVLHKAYSADWCQAMDCFYFVMKQRTCARILINLALSPSRKIGSGKSVSLTKQCGAKQSSTSVVGGPAIRGLATNGRVFGSPVIKKQQMFTTGEIRLCKPVASYSSLETHQECVSPVGLDTLSPGWWLGVILILLLLSFVQGGYLAALWGRERLGR